MMATLAFNELNINCITIYGAKFLEITTIKVLPTTCRFEEKFLDSKDEAK